MAKKTEQDKKSIEEQVVFLRKEAEQVAEEVTQKRIEFNTLVQEIVLQKNDIARELANLEEEKKKLSNKEEVLKDSEANLNKKFESAEVVLKELRKQIKEETKRLTTTNEWVLTARKEGEDLRQNNGVLALEIERRTNILSDINSLAQAKNLLEEEVYKIQQNLVEITRNCNEAVMLSKKQIGEDTVRLAILKGDILRETTALHERLNERKRIENDISIYISRARAIYSKSFPELEMNL